jgi:phosphoribosyl 1,2-cyclic phosphodiesterase
MSLFITSLNSGSNGNCYYIGNDTEAVLIDAGISCRETEKRMKRLGLPEFQKNIRYLFILLQTLFKIAIYLLQII